MTVTTGLETLVAAPADWLAPDARVGLLTNPTGVDRRLRSGIGLLHEHPGVTLAALYGPEHGVRGDAQAGAAVPDAIDPHTGLPEISLYNQHHAIPDHAFDGIDVLLIDLQDAGVRFYTNLALSNSATKRATAAGVRVVVLDRPNPIAWMGVFGNRVEPELASIVGAHGLPVTHACTMGELLRFMARRDDRAMPGVVPLTGWDRSLRWEHTGLPWVPPSPNLPTPDSVQLYPVTCWIEGTTLSEGRGTTRPFEIVGGPTLNAWHLAESLQQLDVPGYAFRPTAFAPTFQKHANILCHGVQIHPLNGHHAAILPLGPHLLNLCKQQAGDGFDWIGFGNVPFIDRLAGTASLRQTVDNAGNIDELLDRWRSESATFVNEIGADLIYGPVSSTQPGGQR